MNLNLDLAWRRLSQESLDSAFTHLAYECDLVKHKLDEWLMFMDTSVRTNTYVPKAISMCDVPKGKHLLRPGNLLSLGDSLVYHALIGSMYELICASLRDLQGTVDFSYLLSGKSDRVDWLKNRFTGWNSFRQESIVRAQSPNCHYILVADITAFYENIDFSMLSSDLKQLGADEKEVNLLSKCLNRWAQVNGVRGIPQGSPPSHILAKVYLSAVDRGLINLNYQHVRYNDDIRIFCKSELDAKRAIVNLNCLLRSKGLTLHSSKTRILTCAEAVEDFDRIQRVILDMSKELVQEEASVEEEDLYGLIKQQHSVRRAAMDIIPDEVLTGTFDSFFINDEYGGFDKSLFHFLVRRFGERNNYYATRYCKSLLFSHPEETSSVLEYYACINYAQGPEIITDFVCSEESIYDYQNYQLISYLSKNINVSSDSLLERVRLFAFESTSPYYLKSVARKFLGIHGNIADLERMRRICDSVTGIEQAELVCCLFRLEKGKRNALLARVDRDFFLVKSAISYVQELSSNYQKNVTTRL